MDPKCKGKGDALTQEIVKIIYNNIYNNDERLVEVCPEKEWNPKMFSANEIKGGR